MRKTIISGFIKPKNNIFHRIGIFIKKHIQNKFDSFTISDNIGYWNGQKEITKCLTIIHNNDNDTLDMNSGTTPTFPKSVSIVEGDNTTMEFEPMEANDDDVDNYGLVNPPVD